MNTPLVLLHGWGMNSNCWGPLLEAGIGRDLLPMDLPGHGKRLTEPLPKNLDSLVEQMLSSAPPEAIWCGWSLGSQVAMRAAIIAPERVRGLALIAPTPRFVNGNGWRHGMDPEFFRNFEAAVKQDPVASLKRFVLLMFDGCVDARRRSRDYYQALAEGGFSSGENLIRGLQILAETDLRADLHQIEQPVFMLSGGQDSICPTAASVWLQQQFGWSLMQIEDGHAPQFSHPERVLEMDAKIYRELCFV